MAVKSFWSQIILSFKKLQLVSPNFQRVAKEAQKYLILSQ